MRVFITNVSPGDESEPDSSEPFVPAAMDFDEPPSNYEILGIKEGSPSEAFLPPVMDFSKPDADYTGAAVVDSGFTPPTMQW